MPLVDNVFFDDSPRRAAHTLSQYYTLDRHCSKCDRRHTLGLILGDESLAIGVLVCPNCGYDSHLLIADPGGHASSDDGTALIHAAQTWVPHWHPGSIDVTPDWRCACGQIWADTRSAQLHIDAEHPKKKQLDISEHDRYPWVN